MSNFILAIAILVFVLAELFITTSRLRKIAYQWWHIPWFAFVYTILIYLIYHLFHLPNTVLLGWLVEDYKIEVFYCIVGLIVWLPLQLLLRSPFVHNSLIKIYRKLFAKDEEDAKTRLPFPYYYSTQEENKVKSRVGRVFYRLTLKSAVIIIAVVYAAALVVAHYYPNLFFPISAFGILGILPLMEYFFYLGAEVETENEVVTDDGESDEESDFDELWRLYVDIFDNYSVAWKRIYDEKGKLREGYEKSNDSSFDGLYTKFKDDHGGGIIEDCDLLTAFSKLVPFFMHVIKEGHYILVAFDIPKHFSTSKQDSYMKEIASKLTSVLVKRFPMINEITKFIVCDETSTLEVFDNSIVMAPLALLARRDMKDKEWMKNLGLITVVNVFDKGVSNLFENRKFGYILQSVNKDYQIIVVSAFRKELEPSLEKTWLTTEVKSLEDCKMVLYPRSERQYFVGYNFEEWEDRFKKVLSAKPNDALYSGSEMMVFPLSPCIGENPKPITPVHQLELAYTNALEGNEEIKQFVTYFKKDYFITVDNVNNKVKPHILPVDEIIEHQTFSVIYDNENNAPTSYMKWIHIGNDENFSIVISKPYLFRDYFNANHDYFIQFPFSAVQPRMCNSRITLAIILLSLLKESEQEEDVIKSYLLKYYEDKEIDSIPGILKDLFSTYFSDDLANDLRTSKEVVFDGVAYETHVKFRLVHPDRVNLPYLDIITVKDGNGNVLFDILRDLLSQNFNKGQHHSFSGWPYLISDFDRVNKTLVVTRSDEIANNLFYKPCYNIKVSFGPKTLPIKGTCESGVYYHHTGIELAFKKEAFETEICVDTRQWVVFGRCYAAPKFASGSSQFVPASPTETPMRKYPNGKILKLSLRYMSQYADSIEKVRKALQLLFYEGLQSLFPHHAQYLIVTCIANGNDNKKDDTENLPWIFHNFQCNDSVQDGWLDFYFIEDAHIDLGLIGALTYENIWYLMGYVFDYLLWLSEGPGYPDGYIEYLNRKNLDKLSFLKYGKAEMLDFFDLDLTINFIRDHFTTEKDNLMQMQEKRQTNTDVNGECDFCGKKMKNSEMQRLGDGRMRCPDCSVDAIDTDAQFKEVCEKVKAAFVTHLGIDFSVIPHKSRLVSAVELHKAGGYKFSVTNGYDVRKIVGLACDKETDVYYVENGYKPNETFGIIAHEMTHIWEYNNDDFKKIGVTNEDWVEGLAVWTDLFLSDKEGMASMEERKEAWLARDDEYGRGFKLIMENCPDDPYGYIKKEAKKH
jgi:hypothetical protein